MHVTTQLDHFFWRNILMLKNLILVKQMAIKVSLTIKTFYLLIISLKINLYFAWKENVFQQIYFGL